MPYEAFFNCGIYNFMPVVNKDKMLSQLAFMRLHLSHIAIGSWPCCNVAAKPVNIFFTILEKEPGDESCVRDVVNDIVLPLTPGHCYFMPCNHKMYWNLTPRLKFVSIHFNLEFFYGIDIFTNYPECIQWQDPALAEELPQLIQKQEDLASLCRMKEILYRIIGRFLTVHPVKALNDSVKYERYLPVLDFVRKRGNASTRVEDMAEIMKVRSNVFSRNFSRDFGIPPKLFLVNTLVRKASTLLSMPGSKVKDVAGELNFQNEFYFSNFFKKNTGFSPRDFQKRNRIIPR